MTLRRSDGQTVGGASWLAVMAAAVVVAACSHKPPENFAPDPVLAGKLRSINILTRIEAAEK